MDKYFTINLKNSCIFFVGLILILFTSCNKTKKTDCSISETPTYTKDIAPIIKAKCFKCHAKEVYKSKASRNKIYDFKSLKKMAESGFLIGAITHQKGFIPMPYKSNKKIDDCSISIISKWVKTGMKE